ncbi:MAG: hypothetical protein H7Z40_05295 [Phycisphaerae bacterium]|nr:hypothetical protein [Gemmatimonadaceae bacterium]
MSSTFSQLTRLGAALTVAALFGCGENTTPPVSVPPTLRVVRGAAGTDTIEAFLTQAITVEVRGEDGQPKGGVPLRFEAPGPPDPSRPLLLPVFICSLGRTLCGNVQPALYVFEDTTRADGRASVVMRMGTYTGRTVVRISSLQLSLSDSAVFNVLPGAPFRLRAISTDTTLYIGTSAALPGIVLDRRNNPRADATTVSAGAGNAVSVAPATGLVIANDLGEQWVYMRAGSLIDSTLVRSAPEARLVVWDGAQTVQLVNTNGSNVRPLQNNTSTSFGTYPRFTTDRRSVLFYGHRINNGEWVLMDTSGTPRREFTTALGLRAVQALRLLPDGNVLVVSWGATPVEYFVYRVSPNNTITQLRALPGILADAGGHADISPDGTRVAYQSFTGVFERRELRIVDIASGNTTVVSPNGNSPQWNAAGDKLLFLEGSTVGPAVIVNADGTGRRNITRSFLFSPGMAWSPDGRYIIGRSEQFPQQMLRVVRLSDNANVVLKFKHPTSGASLDFFQPDWR